MLERFLAFARGVAATRVGAAGVVLTTSSFALFVLFQVFTLAGIITNAYVGLISYLALPALFVIGLVLIPLGWWLFVRRTGRTAREALAERFDPGWTESKLTGSRLATWIVGLTVVNVLFLGAGSARMLSFMDQPSFCGTACHSVMSPEWTTYQQSAHAHVACVECHVGEGAGALIDSKINGTWQMISVTFDLYERPIPTPVHQLRPARETCEKCHWPEKFYGRRVETFTHYAEDEASTPSYTTLVLNVGSGTGTKRGEIHWHIAAQNEVRYASVDDEREAMLWVDVRQPDGSFKRFHSRRFTGAGGAARTLDCVDCHNRATHVYEDPRRAVDRRIRSGEIDRSLPWAKKAALGALTGNYHDRAAADRGVEADFRGFYARDAELAGLAVDPRTDRAVEALRATHQRNIHPGMNVGWNPYPDHIGHERGGGCFRCHNPDLEANDGSTIPNECTLCHSFLAYESDDPYQFLKPDAQPDKRAAALEAYLRTTR